MPFGIIFGIFGVLSPSLCGGCVSELWLSLSPVCLISSCSVLKQCKDVELSFSDVTGKPEVFKGTKKGMLYLTPYRVSVMPAGLSPSCGILQTSDLKPSCCIEDIFCYERKH